MKKFEKDLKDEDKMKKKEGEGEDNTEEEG